MDYCPRCMKNVNIYKMEADISISVLYSHYCEECGGFIKSGFDERPAVLPKRKRKKK